MNHPPLEPIEGEPFAREPGSAAWAAAVPAPVIPSLDQYTEVNGEVVREYTWDPEPTPA